MAVGGSGKLATSLDGVTWTQRTSSFGTAPILCIVYANNLWVAVGGNGKLATSTNATSWTQRTSSFGTTYIYRVSYGSGRWTAAGDLGKLASSTNGTSWTQRVSAITSTRRIRGVVTLPTSGLAIAAGDAGAMSTSTNSTVWTASTDASFASTTISALVIGSTGSVLAVGFLGKIGFATPTSMSTISDFKQLTSNVTATLTAATYGGNKYIAVGANGTIVTSNG